MTIRELQSALQAAGFDPGPIDGAMGPRTRAAIRAFQSANGLAADGVAGPRTRAVLFGPSEERPKPDQSIPSDMPWLAEAARLIGVRENTSPRADNAVIMDWADVLDIGYASDEVPWCGLFVAHCMATGVPEEPLPSNPLGARNWMTYGTTVPAQLGAVMVFWRTSPQSWKGHVALYWAEDDTHYHVLGGNQSNAVNIKRMPKSRFLQAQWPSLLPPQNIRRIGSANGVLESVTEA